MGISKRARNTIIVCAAAVAALACGAGIYINHEKNTGVYLKGTTLSGEDISGLTPEQVSDQIKREWDTSVIEVTENGQVSLSGKLSDYGYTIDDDALSASLRNDMEQEKTAGNIIKSLFGGKTQLENAKTYNVDTDTFNQKVSVANLSVARVASADAYLTYDSDSGEVVIVPEVYGNEISDDDLRTYVGEQIDKVAEGKETENASSLSASSATASTASTADTGSSETAAVTEPSDTAAGMFSAVFFIPSDLYPQPSIKKDNTDLASEKAALDAYKGTSITYDFGDDKVPYDFGTIMTWFDIADGNVSLSEDKVGQFVSELADKYDTRYKERKFRTTSGTEITISASTNVYGYTVDQDEETSQLMKDVESKSAVEREPVYIATNSFGNPYYYKRTASDDLAGTYVEVSISDQRMWFYKDGELKLSSSVVTGDTTKGHGTSTGVYPIAYKQSPSVLRGGSGSGAYESKVSYWMPFNEGQGLHDASWRSAFGGSIYRGNGSHGCVNLPPSVAASLYSMVEPGMAVVVHY